MGKMNELAAQLSELKRCGEILIGISESLTELFSGSGQPEETPAAAPATEAPPKEEAPREKPLTLEEVRAVLAEKSRSGHTAEVRALLLKHGADKLSEINPAEYPALLAEVEVL